MASYALIVALPAPLTEPSSKEYVPVAGRTVASINPSAPMHWLAASRVAAGLSSRKSAEHVGKVPLLKDALIFSPAVPSKRSNPTWPSPTDAVVEVPTEMRPEPVPTGLTNEAVYGLGAM